MKGERLFRHCCWSLTADLAYRLGGVHALRQSSVYTRLDRALTQSWLGWQQLRRR